MMPDRGSPAATDSRLRIRTARASGMISRERVADSDQPLRSRENLSLHLLAAWAFLAQNARLFVGSPMARVLRSRGDSVAARGATCERTEAQPEPQPERSRDPSF